MNGVEILAVEQVATVFTFNWVAFWITAGIIILVFVAGGALACLTFGNWEPFLGFVTLGIVLSIMLGVLAGFRFAKPIEYTNQYKVTVSDDVSIDEFMEKYEIIEQDGRVYTVREK